ncbi:MAG: bifunctional phosphoribosylaminoimidazolecarboxamide formyltransferase/IMP cyclohydrolase, partial [Longimicrobiales bacterium]|nr:bifunctional phosphoribosylaminoimidazolecarboxamide formyltransferase/IMP cyclohydrolase [Longimicrobiales bacterium]
MSNRRALLSVSDKTGIQELGAALVERGWELLSTGGTARKLREADLPVTDVSEVTSHPEMMDGRVKTLHPAIHAGILARRSRDDDLEALEDMGYGTIDLVVVNLYPFQETVAREDVHVKEAMEQVDIGGPTMIRAAAKSHRDVWVVVEPRDYGRLLDALDGALEEEPLRRELAGKVFRHMAGYDLAIAEFLEERGGAAGAAEVRAGESGAASGAGGDSEDGALTDSLSLGLQRLQTLRYGENPDQEAAFYAPVGPERSGLAALEQRHGKELSYNNLLDLDGALLSLAPFAFSPRPAVAIIKHTTPCGLAVGDTLHEAYEKALATDPVSAFGSIIAVNRPVDPETAAAIHEHFVECVVGPAFTTEAFETLSKKKSLRLLVYPSVEKALELEPEGDEWWEGASPEVRGAARFLAAHSRIPEPRAYRSVYGGALVQTPPIPPFYTSSGSKWDVVTEREPTAPEWDDLRFAWGAVFGVKSNAILLARDGATLGIGAGQMSRVDASKIAVRKAGEADLDLEGSVLASDAFFPFRDGVDAAADAGV